ncbi:MAG: hypothetical protein HC923_01565 [Myxococcales bacterium]|nr:hypothetical protein [Myxococcales bacterium]
MRLPFACIAIFTMWAVYRIARRISGRVTGVVAAVVLGTCPQFVFIGKQAMVDMPLVGLMTIGLAFFIDAAFGPNEENEARPDKVLGYGAPAAFLLAVGLQVAMLAAGVESIALRVGLFGALAAAVFLAVVLLQRPSVRTARLVLFYVFMGLAALSKGLAVLAVVGPTVLLYMLFTADWRILLRSGVLWGGIVFLLVAAPWYVVLSLFPGRDDEGLTFVQRFWFHDNFNRVGSGVHGDRGGIGYFFEQLAYAMFPWFALLPPALVHALSTDRKGEASLELRRRAHVFVILLAAWTWVFFSSSETKFHHYIFPAVPALAVVVGVWFSHLAKDPSRRIQTFLLILVAALLGAAAQDLVNQPSNLVNLFTYKYDRPYPKGLHAREFLGAFVGISAAIMVLAAAMRRKDLLLLGFAALGLMVGPWCSHHHFNMLSQHWSQYHLWETYHEERRDHEPIYAYQLNWRGETFYSRNRVLQVMKDNANQRLRELAEQPGREFVIVEQSRYDTMVNVLPVELRKKARILDQSNDNFYLVLIDDELRAPRLLILSDLHLGRDCKAITGFRGSARPDADFDRAFIDMLGHYTAGKELEWKLILAGDFIDFVEVVLVPDEKGPANLLLTFEPSKEERSYGLGTEAERALVKLEMTLDYHQAFFEALARFVRRGGELVMLRGNHDAEMHWKKVQRVLRRRLAELAFRGESHDLDELLEERETFQARIEFAPWFYLEPGRIYVEHGHQYDTYCSFDLQLLPVSPKDPKRIDTPLFMFAMRYFVNMMTDLTPHSMQAWSSREFLEWMRRRGPAGILYAVRMALGASGRAVFYAAQFAYGRVGQLTREHGKRLTEEASKWGVPAEKLRQLDALHTTPITRNLPELMRLLFLDRILLALVSLALVLLVLVVVESVWWELAAIAAIGVAAYRFNQRLAPRRFLVPGPKQAQAANDIVKIMDVPLVVMGHSHVRRMTELDGGRWYVNTGCWLPPLPSRDHVDPSAPCTCKLSHLVVIGAEPMLRVFCKASKSVREADIRITRPASADGEPEGLDTTMTLPPGVIATPLASREQRS